MSSSRKKVPDLPKYSFYLWIFCASSYFYVLKVSAQCDTGFERSCTWIHDARSVLRFESKSESGERYIELSKCKYPNCGPATIQTRWLQPRFYETSISLQYKIYGTSEVQLSLSLKTDTTQLHTLGSKAGNYAHGFPQSWKTMAVTVPAIDTRHKLVIKANTPYDEAFVAIRDINLDPRIIIPTSTELPPTESEEDENIPDDYNEQNEVDDDFLGGGSDGGGDGDGGGDEGDVNEERNEDEEEYDNDFQGEREFEEFQVTSFITAEDLKTGYTEVVEPEICMFKPVR